MLGLQTCVLDYEEYFEINVDSTYQSFNARGRGGCIFDHLSERNQGEVEKKESQIYCNFVLIDPEENALALVPVHGHAPGK